MSGIENSNQPPVKRKRNPPGMPDPDAEVIALSPETLMATNRFMCEICNKGFQRDQNLQLHRRGHNMPGNLRQRNANEVVRKRVYVCPEILCVHHLPSRALGDLTGIKKHFCRKHGEKRYKCDRCSKMYAVESDVKAHMRTCGTKEYRCECGTLFSRAYCDALALESHNFDSPPSFAAASPSSGMLSIHNSAESMENHTADKQPPAMATSWTSTVVTASGSSTSTGHIPISNMGLFGSIFNASTSPQSSSHSSLLHSNIAPISRSLYTPTIYRSSSENPRPQQHYALTALSATALLQKAAQMGSTSSPTSFLPGVWAAPPPNHPQSFTTASAPSHSNNSTMKLGSNFMASELDGSSSGYLINDKKPMTLDFLGLGLEDDEVFSDGFTAALLTSIDGGGETWEAVSKWKGPLL